MAFSRTISALSAAAATAVLVAGCGGGSATSSSSASGKKGGTFTATFTSFPDYLDPALTYTSDGWVAMRTAYNGLLVFQRGEGAEGTKIVPGLAEDMPQVSSDGLTYTLTLRKGLKYSDGTAVKASDFQRTIQRVLNLESGASSFYQAIKGATAYIKAGKATAPISGITTDNATRKIAITLEKPNGQVLDYLAIPFAALVPGDTPFKNQTTTPPPGVGPMIIKNVRTGRGYSVVRNPNFTPLPNIPAASPDRVDVQIVKNVRRQVTDVLSGKTDAMLKAPTADLMQRVKREAAGRYEEVVTNSAYYLFLNNTVKPFTDVKVRQAVAYAIDERAISRFYGGLLQPTCNYLPPGMIGYKKIDPCPYGDPNAGPDLAKAKALIKEAGATGQKVMVWGDDEPPAKATAEYVADALNQIGLKATPKIVEASAYFGIIGSTKTRAQIGYFGWSQDFPHPADFLFLVNGKSIQETNNVNYGSVNDPEFNKIVDTADENPDLAAVADDYAKADRLLIERAEVLPYGNGKEVKFTAPRVNFAAFQYHQVFNQELTTLSLK